MKITKRSFLGSLLIPILFIGGLQNPVSNPGVVEIDHPEAFSRIMVLSDAHGMYPQLVHLLQQGGVMDAQNHWSAGPSLLVVVGDSIDKGAQSIEVLDLWLSLIPAARAVGGNVLHLLGNHEAEFLADPTGDHKAAEFLQELAAHGIPLDQVTDPAFPRGNFLRSLPLAAKIGKWLFVHAGAYPGPAWGDFAAQAASVLASGNYGDPYLIADNSMLENKTWWIQGPSREAVENNLTQAGFYGVVFGHEPLALNVAGADAISDDGRLVKIDNGMAPEAGAHPGSLLVFPYPADLNLMATPRMFTLVQGQAQTLQHEQAEAPAPSEFRFR